MSVKGSGGSVERTRQCIEMGQDVIQAVGAEAVPQAATLDAFEALTDRCLDESYRLAAVVLRDQSEAQDVVHDAVLIGWRKFGSLRDPARFDAWFGRIVLNLCRDRLRARRRGQVREAALVAETEMGHRDDFGRVIDRDAIAAAFPKLDPDLQLVVALRFYKDLQLGAIAELLGIPLGTVKSRLHTGLKRLRAELDRAGWRGENER